MRVKKSPLKRGLQPGCHRCGATPTDGVVRKASLNHRLLAVTPSASRTKSDKGGTEYPDAGGGTGAPRVSAGQPRVAPRGQLLFAIFALFLFKSAVKLPSVEIRVNPWRKWLWYGQSILVQRRSRALPITLTSDSAMAAAAIRGLSSPSAARGIASTL